MKRIVRFSFVFFQILFLLFLLQKEALTSYGKEKVKDYKVLIGANKATVLKQRDIDLLVIDAEYFTKKEISGLKKRGIKKVFSYFNVGSIEDFRKDYNKYKHLRLGDYENWEEEIWVDVSNPDWQKRMKANASKMKKKGVDGLFIDNTDVYYHFPREEIYGSLLNILKGLRKSGMPLLINGGDRFVKKAIEREEAKNLIFGINQETVFTRIDFENGTYGVNEEENKEYFKEYVEQCGKLGMKIYLLEYGADRTLKKEIQKYCRKHGFHYAVSQTLELDR